MSDSNEIVSLILGEADDWKSMHKRWSKKVYRVEKEEGNEWDQRFDYYEVEVPEVGYKVRFQVATCGLSPESHLRVFTQELDMIVKLRGKTFTDKDVFTTPYGNFKIVNDGYPGNGLTVVKS